MQSFGEFALIQHYFARPSRLAALRQGASLIKLGIGDDSAILPFNAQNDLIITTDTLIEGVHFLPKTNPRDLAERALAVNFSDLIAMGGKPYCYLLSLTLPQLNRRWLEVFSRALHRFAHAHDCSLIGGNTTQGALAINITALGLVKKNRAILRSGAQVGDRVWVSGHIGLAALGLAIATDKINLPSATLTKAALRAFHRPQPPIALGQQLIGIASSMIDVSDGLLQDARHLAEQSQVAISINLPKLTQHWNRSWLQAIQTIAPPLWQKIQCSGGDDYQLLFSAPAHATRRLLSRAKGLKIPVTHIGEVIARHQKGQILIVNENGENLQGKGLLKGYQHFGADR